MANTMQAKKRVRQTERKTEVNKARKSRVRTFIKKVETLIASGDQAAAAEALKVAQPEIQRGAQKGIMHGNTADRKISRLAAAIKKLGA